MFVFHKKGLVLDGKSPTLLTGYGGFNVSLMPAFSRTAYLWMEHGGVFAVANLRENRLMAIGRALILD